ncbi:DUF4190 domain-containing protein [Leucobacter aridicollis]|uniref:Thiol:disulfide interchange protein n=1 Tax=Leucobacter aridicollis TaxID=283878 RepID=A0A852R401_9MICO|nr:DUF4190 domain-containing protein [Leucobacter aridicollis]NYD25698.1 thiol:disulfide interchange protein [Leucobacter aridicollis]
MTTDAHPTQLPGSDVQTESAAPDTSVSESATPAAPEAPAQPVAPTPTPVYAPPQATVPQVTLPQATVPPAPAADASPAYAAAQATASQPTVSQPTVQYTSPYTGSTPLAQQAQQAQQLQQAPQPGGYAVPPQGGYAAPPQAPYYAVPGHLDPEPGKNSYGFAIASFVIGIASILSAWTFVAPIVGLVLGILALRRNTKERTLALWGVWLNGAMLAFAAVGLVLLIGLTSFGFFAGAASYGF